MSHVLGFWIFVATLIHIPQRVQALNAFDPPKRLVWWVGLLMLWAWTSWRGGERGCGRNRIWFGLLMGVLLFRTALLSPRATGIEQMWFWLLPCCAFRVGQNLEASDRDVRVLSGWCLATGIFQIALMLLQRTGLDPLFGLTTRWLEYPPARMVGTVGYQNQAMDMLILLGLALFRWLRRPPMRVGLVCVLIGMDILTAYRGGFLALLAILLLEVWLWRPRPSARIFAVVCVSMVIATGLLSATEPGETFRRRLAELFDPASSPAWRSRQWMWRAAVEQIRDQPLMGIGPGGFAREYPLRLGSILPKEKTHDLLRHVVYAREAHFDLLQFVAEFGLVGLVALVCWLRAVVREPPQSAPTDGSYVPHMALAMFVLSCLNFSWQTATAGPLAGWLLGMGFPMHFAGEGKRVGWAGRVETAGMSVLLVCGLAISVVDVFLNLHMPASIKRGYLVQMLESIPPYSYPHKALAGAAFAEAGDFWTAEQLLLEAAKGHTSPQLWNNLGSVYMALGRYPEAYYHYTQWAASGLLHAEALWNLSVCQEALGDYPGAADRAMLRLRLWPETDSREYLRAAVLGLKAGQPDLSRDLLLASRRYWHRWPEAELARLRNAMGACYMAGGRKEEARAWFLGALESDPGLESAMRNLRGLDATP